MTSRWRALVARLVWPDALPFRDADSVVCHEWLAVLGGSDKVAAELASLVDADVVYTFALDARCLSALDLDIPVVTWRFGRWAGRSRRFTAMLPLMPVIWWALELGSVRRLVTSSHACVNAVRAPGANRVCYCHTPMRYAWAWRLERGRLWAPLRPLMPLGAAALRALDRRWSRRVDTYLANSTYVRDRICQAYGRDAIVVPPPVDVDLFAATDGVVEPVGFVTAGRWVPYKRFDLAITAAGLADVPLVVAGGGPDEDRLRALAGPTVTFVADPDDDQLARLLAGADAFLFCGVEDFGILPVEAQAAGAPVIGRDEGGSVDSIIDGVTGCFVRGDDPRRWAAVLADFDRDVYDREAIRSHAARFGVERFRRQIAEVLRATAFEDR